MAKITVSSPEELRALCEERRKSERQLELEIAALLDQEPSFRRQLDQHYRQLPDPQLLRGDLEQLAGQIAFTASLAANVSSKIRRLDAARSNVAGSLRRVDDVLELKYCTSNVQQSLAAEDYEKAAAHIHRFLAIDISALRRSASTIGDPSDDQSLSRSSLDEAYTKLQEAERSLKQLVLTKFNDAVRQRDEPAVQRFFKLFPLLNEHELGLARYSAYLAVQLGDPSGPQDEPCKETALVQLMRLFEQVAKLLSDAQPQIETFYGPGRLIDCVRTLQAECDLMVKSILARFEADQQLRQLRGSIQRLLKNGGDPNSNLVRLDPLDIDPVLDQMVQIAAKSEHYLSFVLERATRDLDPLDRQTEEFQSRSRQIEQLRRDCELSRLVQELDGDYVLFEQYFLRESASKAIRLDDVEAHSINSSMLGDVFFVVKRCVKRAFAGKSVDVLCAVVNFSLSILDGQFFDTLNERLRYGYPSSSVIATALDLSQAYSVLQTGRYLPNSSEIERNRLLFLISLNNLDVACSYCKSLRSSVQKQVREELPEGENRDQQLKKLDSCLVEFDQLIAKFQASILTGLRQLCGSTLKAKLKAWADAFQAENHVLFEQDIARFESTDGLRVCTQEFLVEIDGVLNGLKASLTVENQQRLVDVLAEELCRRLEQAVRKCNFNKLGGFQMSRELRAVMNYATAASDWSIRYKFARLNQIGALLSMERLEELDEICGSEAAGRRRSTSGTEPTPLSGGELKQILRLRSDLPYDKIRRLKL